jgi:subtilisin family serine protease
MLNSSLSFDNRRVRLISSAVLFLGLVAFGLIVSPPRSRARLTTSARGEKKTKAEYVPGQVLVRYTTDVSAKQQPSALKVEGRSIPIQVERFEGSDMIAGLRLARVAPDDTMNAIAALKAQPDVLYAEPNYIMHADLTPNDPSFGSLYGMTKIGAPTAWNTTTGSGSIVVGMIDEGVDISHPDLQANIFTNPSPGAIPGITGDLHGYDFVNNSGTITPGDHATHTAGTVGAVGNNGVGVVGVAWTVKLMSLRFLGPGGGSDSDAIRAYTYAKQMRDLFVSSGGTQGANMRILSNSYGGGGFSQASLDAIRALNTSGILFVASDGNDGIDSDLNPHYPSGYDSPNVISLVATDSADALAGFSNFGAQSATIGAPGVSILSTTTSNTYSSFSGTSMATPHVSGAAALLLSQNPNLTVQQLKALLIFNGDLVSSLSGKTLTGRRLNVANSLTVLAQNDVTPPGTVAGLMVSGQTGRTVSLSWIASGDDGAAGTASLYQLSFIDSATGVVIPLQSLVPPTSHVPQNLDVQIPFGHNVGTIQLREFDKAGNEGTPATVNVSISFAAGNPYAKALGANEALSTGGTHLNFNCDDCYKTSALPFPFPFFGQNFNSVTVASNGNLYFTPPAPPTRPNGDADDVPSASGVLANFKMIAGLWDDLYLGTDQRADADVYFLQKDANTVIFRWQGVPCNDAGFGCTFGGPVNFEIELNSNGTIKSRYGSGNTSLFPVVGISGGAPEAYLVTSHTSENTPTNLTNAETVIYIPRTLINPLDSPNFFVGQNYRDFLSRESDPGGLSFWVDQIAGNASNSPAPCAPGDTTCVNTRRVNVSDAFFVELEFQQTAAYVYRVYREAFGNTQPTPNPNPDPMFPGEDLKMPSYPAFAADRALVVGGANLAQSQLDFANAFVQRSQFISRYPASQTLTQFVDAILLTIQNDLGSDLTSQRNALIALGSRGAVVYRLANDDLQNGNGGINNRSFIDAEYNRAFVFGEYGGYLRRDSDMRGFVFWLGQVNSGPLRDVGKQHAMVCSFITSGEYQLRFSSIISHGNGECPQ